ncbi:MAG: type II secretion system protein [Phycisphaerae bacterium]
MAKRAFTLVELLVVISIILVLVAILVPVISNNLRDARRTACLTNLSTIAKAVASWQATSANSSGGTQAFPMVFTSGDPNTAAMGTSNDVNTLDSAKPNAMQNVWRLIAEQYVPDSAFKCPGDSGWAQRSSSDKYGWVSRSNFSYGIQWPYASDGTNTNPAAISSNSLAPGVVIMADLNPTNVAKGPNHQEGIMVMTADKNVSYYKPATTAAANLAGFKNDNIYKNVTAAVAGGIPQSATDTSITPSPAR